MGGLALDPLTPTTVTIMVLKLIAGHNSGKQKARKSVKTSLDVEDRSF